MDSAILWAERKEANRAPPLAFRIARQSWRDSGRGDPLPAFRDFEHLAGKGGEEAEKLVDHGRKAGSLRGRQHNVLDHLAHMWAFYRVAALGVGMLVT